jgi:ParB-like chromosome segregation protein Spo0J
MHTGSNLIEVPFNKLFVWDGNVRKTGIESGLDELASSIAAHGLINPLLVRKEPKGRYAVIADSGAISPCVVSPTPERSTANPLYRVTSGPKGRTIPN